MFTHRKISGLFLLLLLLAACQTSATPPALPSVMPSATPATSTSPTRLNISLNSEPVTLDIHQTSSQETSTVINWICEPLVYLDMDLTNKPLLAEGWKMAADGRAITVTLRQDVVFHDGTPLTAEAVKFTFERLQQPTSETSPLYENVKGVRIQAADQHTVIFQFDEPYFDFLSTLRNVYAVILSPNSLDENGNFKQSPVCTGPYKIQKWAPTQYIRLEKNPAYAWAPAYYENRGAPHIDEVQINFIPDTNANYLALKTGELDALSLSTTEEVAEIGWMPEKFSLQKSWSGGISFLGFRYSRGVTAEPAVRQAIAHAIDKQVIVDTFLPDIAEPAFAPLTPSTYGFTTTLASAGYAFDPDKSRQLLAEAGFSDDNGDGVLERNGEALRLTLLTTTNSTYGKIFVLLQNQLKEVGVAIDIRAVETAEIPSITANCDFDLLLYHYNWPFPDALQVFLGTEKIGASNRVCYSNPEMDAVLAQAFQLPDEAPEKLPLLIQAQKMILADAPWQPLFARKNIVAVNQRVQGVKVHPAEGVLWLDAFIAPDAP